MVALFGLSGIVFAESFGADRQSGYALMSKQTQAMQDDPLQNPATFWLLDGQTIWEQKAGKKDVSCAGCHGDAEQSMKGVAASFPKIVNRHSSIHSSIVIRPIVN